MRKITLPGALVISREFEEYKEQNRKGNINITIAGKQK